MSVFSGLMQRANLTDLLRREFGESVIFAFETGYILRSMFYHVLHIATVCVPTKIISTIVKWVAIVVASFHSFRTWSYEGDKNKVVGKNCFGNTLVIQSYVQADTFVPLESFPTKVFTVATLDRTVVSDSVSWESEKIERFVNYGGFSSIIRHDPDSLLVGVVRAEGLQSLCSPILGMSLFVSIYSIFWDVY